MQRSYFLNLLFFLVFTSFFSGCKSNESSKDANHIGETDRLQQSLADNWNKSKLSLYVHFGVYSSLAGKWDNQHIDGPSEEIWALANMYRDDYEKAARDFEPDNWNAREIVGLARDIGMKTVILTAKHYDGFCLFETETTNFNTVDFINANRDLVAELAEACDAGNINLGISFSLTDWHLPAAHPMTSHRGAPVTDAHHEINKQQIKELLTNYGPVSELHFHSGINSPEQSKELYETVKKLQPQCMVSNGIGNDFGDFLTTPFNELPTHSIDAPWIMPASIHPSTRGFHENLTSKNGLKTARRKVRELAKVISMGGNYALNIGPRNDGSTSGFEQETLKEIGRWIKVNRNAVFGTKKNPLPSESPFWDVTYNDNKLYLFIDSVPPGKTIELKGLNNQITSARFLGSGIEPEFQNNGPHPKLFWTSPAMADPMKFPIIEIELNEPIVSATGKPIMANSEDTLILNLQNATTQKSISGADRHTAIPSNTAMEWNVDAGSSMNATFKFTSEETGRELLILNNNTEEKLKLQGEEAGLIQNASDTIETGKIFKTSAFFGPLNEVHINPKGNNRIQIARSSWSGLKKNNKNMRPLPMTAHYYYVEIDSENAQQYCYEFSGNDGLQIWLNKEELLLTRNTSPGSRFTRKIVLNLEKGKNVLLIKNYNRTGVPDYFSLEPLPEEKWYQQPLPGEETIETLKIRSCDQPSPHYDINLPNFSVVLTPKKD